MNAIKERTCEELVYGEWQSRRADFSSYMLRADENDELGPWHEYGLGFAYVAPDTFEGQYEGYFRYQLSWGGPSQEIRFFADPSFSIHRIEFWHLNWFDGASVDITEDEAAQWIVDDFEACDMFRSAFELAAERDQ